MRAAVLAVLVTGCSIAVPPDPGLEGLAVSAVAPDTVIPGTKLVVKGASFVDAMWGDATLRLSGTSDGRAIDIGWPATFVDFSTLNVAVDAEMIAAVGGAFTGSAVVEVVATSDGETYRSEPLPVELAFAETLTPVVTKLPIDAVIFVNEKIRVAGSGFLLGGDEGATLARLSGCFALETGGECTPIEEIDVPVVPVDPLARDAVTFPFAPAVAGIEPGRFTGTITLINRQLSQDPVEAEAEAVVYDMVSPQIFTVCTGDPCAEGPPAASLGQYVFVKGGGFVGGAPDQFTELELTGTFHKTGAMPAPAQLTLIPEFVEGSLVRYILVEENSDPLGGALDLYRETGHFTGTVRPIISYRTARVTGPATPLTFDIVPVKQVVYLDYRPSYVEALRDFGLRAVDRAVRERILEVVQQAFAGVNIEFRIEPPTDFALFTYVELTGVDPNNMGLFGYDNTPGKDVNNKRLHDRLGGVNAQTQEGNLPGYGGVFLRSLMAFSLHPGEFVDEPLGGADPVFDEIFDPFRPDVGGSAVRAADVAAGFATFANGDACPATSRADRIACAVWVLGNLVGGTVAHEIGHSLGLAYPYDDGFHNRGDEPNRMMDEGHLRSFVERAELFGEGPAVFCDDEFAYLREILPSDDPEPEVTRPGCY